MKKIFLLSGAVVFLLCSCKKNLPEVGKTAAEKMANEWWVTLDQGGTQDALGIGHFKIATYNSSANDDSIWIDDFQNGWQVKFKAKADYSKLDEVLTREQ